MRSPKLLMALAVIAAVAAGPAMANDYGHRQPPRPVAMHSPQPFMHKNMYAPVRSFEPVSYGHHHGRGHNRHHQHMRHNNSVHVMVR